MFCHYYVLEFNWIIPFGLAEEATITFNKAADSFIFYLKNKQTKTNKRFYFISRCRICADK